MDPAELEREVDRALRALPPPAAPDSLLPRLMAAVRRRRVSPWYRRAWFTWPLGWQAATIAALIVAVVAGAAALPEALRAVSALIDPWVAGPARGLAAIPAWVDAAVHVGQVLWRTMVEPLAPYALAVALLMCLSCAVFGTALNYVLLERTSRQ